MRNAIHLIDGIIAEIHKNTFRIYNLIFKTVKDNST